MKNTTKAIYLAVLSATVCSSSAWAGWWTQKDQGRAISDGGTRVVIRQQAGNTFEDWFWQGRRDGMQFQCPPNRGNCTQRFEINSSKTTSTTKGFSIGATLLWNLQEVGAKYHRQFTRSTSTGTAWAQTVGIRSGQWAQPIAIQKRRWTKGAFNGAHFKLRTEEDRERRTLHYYEWQWRDAGTWTSNHSVGSPYYTTVYKNGPF
jgi:hypothetical protein